MDSSPMVRINAIEAIMNSEDEESVSLIKPCLHDENDEVKKNAYKKYVEECWGTWNEVEQKEYFEKFINAYKNSSYIIKVGDTAIGFYNDEELEDGSYEVGNICIIPEYQGQGIGTDILKRKLEEHKEQDIRIRFFKQNPVGALYEKLGFSLSGETEFHYQMIKPRQNVLKK